MITIMLLCIELPIIMAGIIIAAYYAIDHAARAADRQRELADLEAWLTQIRRIQ